MYVGYFSLLFAVPSFLAFCDRVRMQTLWLRVSQKQKKNTRKVFYIQSVYSRVLASCIYFPSGLHLLVDQAGFHKADFMLASQQQSINTLIDTDDCALLSANTPSRISHSNVLLVSCSLLLPPFFGDNSVRSYISPTAVASPLAKTPSNQKWHPLHLLCGPIPHDQNSTSW